MFANPDKFQKIAKLLRINIDNKLHFDEHISSSYIKASSQFIVGRGFQRVPSRNYHSFWEYY